MLVTIYTGREARVSLETRDGEPWLMLKDGDLESGTRMTPDMLEKLDADISAWMMEHAEGFEEFVKEVARPVTGIREGS